MDNLQNPLPPQAENLPAFNARPWYRSKKVWTAGAVLLFLLVLLSVVPVSKIPFLRNLAYAMGYTPDETKNISFLKALLSWNEHAKMMRGELPDPDEAAIFGAAGGAFNAADATAQNKLFDLRAVNQSLKKQGQQGDYLAGSYNAPGGADEDEEAVRVKNANASARTQANGAKSEVFFGDDASAVARDKNDAFNSTNTLKKVANPPVAGTSGDSWLDRLIDKAVRSETDLSDFAKSMDRSGTALAQTGRFGKLGESRAKRDMYYAWLVGRAARRTPQVILKKTLASSGFDGAEMPRTVFTASGFSGVGINPDDVLADMDNVQKYLDQDKDCQQAMGEGWNMAPPTDEIVENIKQLSGTFPPNCEGINDAYGGMLTTISGQCQQMKRAYEHIRQRCGTLDFELNDTQCDSVKLASHYDEFVATCQDERAKCNELEEGSDDYNTCIANWQNYTPSDGYGPDKSLNMDKLNEEIDDTFYEGTGDSRTFSGNYFPRINWGGSSLVDSSIAD